MLVALSDSLEEYGIYYLSKSCIDIAVSLSLQNRRRCKIHLDSFLVYFIIMYLILYWDTSNLQ